MIANSEMEGSSGKRSEHSGTYLGLQQFWQGTNRWRGTHSHLGAQTAPQKKRQLAFYFLAFLDKPFLSLKSNSQVEFVTGFILVCMIAEAQ